MTGSRLEEARSARGGASGSRRIRWFGRRCAAVVSPLARGYLPALLVLRFLSSQVFAQESPYIVTYDHHLEEPGNLEVEYLSTFGTQRAGNDFHAYWIEPEYGATAWWTTEFYLDGQTTFHGSSVFTGFRWENGFVRCGASTSSIR